jgi:hypothetical protein
MHFPKTPNAARIVCFLLWMHCTAGAWLGQFETSAVLGFVVDSRGGVIQQAKVSLENIDTGATQSTITGVNGTYQILEVRVGTIYRPNVTGPVMAPAGQQPI